MTVISPAAVETVRAQLGDRPEFQELIHLLEQNDWVLEDATAELAGQPVAMGGSFLDKLVERSRQHLCKPETQAGWSDLKDVFDILKEFLPTPAPLAIACIFKLSDIGLRNLCDTVPGE
jgi:hypothetical protein